MSSNITQGFTNASLKDSSVEMRLLVVEAEISQTPIRGTLLQKSTDHATKSGYIVDKIKHLGVIMKNEPSNEPLEPHW